MLKSLKTFHKPGELFDKLAASWTASMKALEENSYISEAIPWIPLQNRPEREASRREPVSNSNKNTEQIVRENVPQILHAGWSQADRDRANQVCPACTPLMIYSPLAYNCSAQVANMVASGQLDTYLFTDIFKGKFVAVFAQDPEENFGLPFWIGKVHDIRPPVEENDSDSDEISEEDVEGRVIIHEYIQKEKTQGEGSTSYVEHNEHGLKQRGSRKTATKKVLTRVAIDQIAYKFDSLTKQNQIRVQDQKWIAYQCEIAARLRLYDCPGVMKFNDMLKIKTLPMD